ncbi:MAG: hypothetical protein LIO65_08175 [Odoribacter sp.]|nr:hypothetical protein [Odoribacter sp.]
MKGNRLLFVLLGLLIIVLVYFNVAGKIEISKQEQLLKSEKGIGRERVEVMLNSVYQSSEVYKSYFLNQDEILDGISYPVLIYRYPQGICSPYFQEDMESLYKLQDNWTKDKILILPAYSEDRNSQLTVQSELNKFNFKNISQSVFSIPFN